MGRRLQRGILRGAMKTVTISVTKRDKKFKRQVILDEGYLIQSAGAWMALPYLHSTLASGWSYDDVAEGKRGRLIWEPEA